MKTKNVWYVFSDDEEAYAHAMSPEAMTTVDLIAQMKSTLDEYACLLMEMVCDDCNVIESDPDFTPDDFTDDEDGNPVGLCYPENGSPELDHARSLILEAIDQLDIRRDQVKALCGKSRPGTHGRGGTLFREQDIGDPECAECESIIECADPDCKQCPPPVKARRKPYAGTQFESDDDDDPTPWCHVCMARAKKDCDCLPIAANH